MQARYAVSLRRKAISNRRSAYNQDPSRKPIRPDLRAHKPRESAHPAPTDRTGEYSRAGYRAADDCPAQAALGKHAYPVQQSHADRASAQIRVPQ